MEGFKKLFDLATFRLSFPEFDSVTDDRVNFYIGKALNYLNDDVFGSCYDEAALYWTAHQLALSQARINGDASSGGASGINPIASATVGGVSVSYHMPNISSMNTTTSSSYRLTPYGLQYLSIRDSCLPGGRLVNVGYC